ncbi:unnamed protein product [Eruca vesicaria subsp. sativa]|uniref:RING-CH-type domain-containing protein n=1 Tax=Eruca vesicaria subsp. sativa TaxID=29727 RepID=A0ABC8JIT3_ERUVS|nr:unnamed protein product [Eruca vesicaria subsp. sativa]
MDYTTATIKEVSSMYNADEENVCRICRNPGDADNPLRYPCACSGSIKFVHEDCLLQWLSYCKARHCEVCKESFSFSPLYAENAPTRLSFTEFAVGVAMKARNSCLPRLSLVVSVWLLIVPLVTFRMWRLFFLRCFGEEAQRLLLSHTFITDCLFGFILSATIIVILRGSTSLRDDYLRHLRYFRHLRVSLYGMIGMEGPLFHLVENAFSVMASNMIFLGAFIFVPFTLGRVILYGLFNGYVTGSSSTRYDVTTLSVGYIFIIFLIFLYLGISWIVGTVSLPLRQFLEAMRIGIRIVTIMVLEFGVFPLIYGWWIDVCTVTMFGQTMSNRLQYLSVSPLVSTLVHWVVGTIYEWYISICCDLLRQVLRPEVLYCLFGPEDDMDEAERYIFHEPVHKVARDSFLASAQIGSSIVLCLFLPIQLAIWMAPPSIFPLDISVSDPFTEIPAGIVLLTTFTPFIIEHFRFQTTAVSLLRCWCTCVGWSKPEDNVGQENVNGEPGRQDRAQVLSILLVAWVTLLLVYSTLIVVSVSLGRYLFNAIPILPITHGIKCNDLYAFFIGMYVFWTTISGAMCAVQHVKSERTSDLFNQMLKLCGIVIKSLVILSIWVLIIPVLIGLLFELLVIVPIRVPVDESPIFLLYQDWTLGIIILNIWTRLIMDDSWREKFERVKEDGFARLEGLWILREIVFPVLMKLLTALCVPYVLARGVFPMLGCSLVVNSAVYRFAWIGCLSVSLLCLCAKRCHEWLRNLHNSIRDERYIIGQRLHNSGEETALAIKGKPKQ